MDCLDVSKKINLKIVELESLKEVLTVLATDKATMEAQYEKEIALCIVGLKNGRTYFIGQEEIKDVPNAVLEKIARGICWGQKLAMDIAESKYKNTLKIIDITEAQLNGYQSINRYLAEV